MRSDLADYAQERLLTFRIIALWVLLTLGVTIVAPSKADQWPLLALFAAAYLAVFRLQDDIADLTHDRERHPDRVLVRSAHVAQFRRLATIGLAGLFAWAWAWFGNFAAVVFVATTAIQLTSGLAYSGHERTRRAASVAVLTKYPALMFLIASTMSDSLVWLVAAVAFVIPLADDFNFGRRHLVLLVAVATTFAAQTIPMIPS